MKHKDSCPECFKGRLYLEPPRTVVVLKGHAPISAIKHNLERLRCNLCGIIFTASPDIGVKIDHRHRYYDPSVHVIISILKNYMGIPFKRLETLQDMVGVPLKDATQWDKEEQFADKIHPVFTQLQWCAAQGKIVYNDDTNVKILSLIKENKTLAEGERRGMFTTAILSQYQENTQKRTICLFLTGRHHSGENVAKIMSNRSDDLPSVIRMADALNSNFIIKLKEHICKCLSHGRRKFVEIFEKYSEYCHSIIKNLGLVYHYDAITKKEEMSDQERLAYHQKHSAPIMKKIKKWLEYQVQEKKVEPNTSLGKAIKYMLNHWEGLTQFLRIPGAPIDNNITERALKIIIRGRKNSLFYKTEHGAYVASMFASLIQTCQMNGVNPMDYLTCLESNSSAIFKAPQDWLPWNYRQTMENQAQKDHPPPNIQELSSLVA